MSKVNVDKNAVWKRTGSAVFSKAREAWGAFGNMSGGYAFVDPATGLRWSSSEAWYQAQRFPHLPELQEEIRAASNGFVAKKAAHARVRESRPDWLEVNVQLMADAIALKAQSERFVAELLASGEMDIVEYSARDDFWGARGGEELRGANVLGQLLMQLRAKLVAEQGPPRGKGMLGML